jgi:hypothetical protein
VGVTVFQRSARAPFIVAVVTSPAVIGFNIAPASSNSACSPSTAALAVCVPDDRADRLARHPGAAPGMRALWLQEAENAVAMSLRGDLGPAEIAEAAATSLGAAGGRGRLPHTAGRRRLQLTGGLALPSGMPASLALQEGVAGQVAWRAHPSPAGWRRRRA